MLIEELLRCVKEAYFECEEYPPCLFVESTSRSPQKQIETAAIVLQDPPDCAHSLQRLFYDIGRRHAEDYYNSWITGLCFVAQTWLPQGQEEPLQGLSAIWLDLQHEGSLAALREDYEVLRLASGGIDLVLHRKRHPTPLGVLPAFLAGFVSSPQVRQSVLVGQNEG